MDKIISNTYFKKAKSIGNATVLFFCSFEGVFSLYLMYLSNEVKNWAFENDKDDTAHLFNL